MALRDFNIETATIQRGENSFKVRGFSPNDIQLLLVNARNSLELVFTLAEASGIKSSDDLTEENIRKLIRAAFKEFPMVIAMVIAIASDELDQFETVMRLPAETQIEALERILRLTFGDATNFGAFTGNVLAVIGTIKSSFMPPTTGTKNPNQAQQVGIAA